LAASSECSIMQCTPLRFSPPRLQIQFSQGISILVARLDAMGLIQYADNASNTMCNFFRNAPKRDGWNYQMKCRDFCAWNSGKRRRKQCRQWQPIRLWTCLLPGPVLPRSCHVMPYPLALLQVRAGSVCSLGSTCSSGQVSAKAGWLEHSMRGCGTRWWSAKI
jgi:hypothetical protein